MCLLAAEGYEAVHELEAVGENSLKDVIEGASHELKSHQENLHDRKHF